MTRSNLSSNVSSLLCSNCILFSKFKVCTVITYTRKKEVQVASMCLNLMLHCPTIGVSLSQDICLVRNRLPVLTLTSFQYFNTLCSDAKWDSHTRRNSVLITSKSVRDNCLLQHTFVDQLVGQWVWHQNFSTQENMKFHCSVTTKHAVLCWPKLK